MIEKHCTYKGEQYSVRDNGEVLRLARGGKRPRPNDNRWTFGTPNENGYMVIASVSIHRIVATAFHGEPPGKEYVVEHIDTNRQNNRPENLLWVTRLENILLNPITAKRIAIVCGSVEAFLADPAKFHDVFQESNIQWMRPVTTEEAQISLQRLLAWAMKDKFSPSGTLDQWIFERNLPQEEDLDMVSEESETIAAMTLNAAQRNWRTASEFPCCPRDYHGEPILAYAKNLKTGSVFCRNEVYSSLVSRSAISDDHQFLYVISESTEGNEAIKPWALARITYENSLFVHTSLGSFFTQEGAEKQFYLAQGLEWTGGDSIDDYC